MVQQSDENLLPLLERMDSAVQGQEVEVAIVRDISFHVPLDAHPLAT